MTRANRRRRYRGRRRTGPARTRANHPCAWCGAVVIGTFGICLSCGGDHRGTWGRYRALGQRRWGR